MQGPRRKWRSRIVLLTLTLAFTATSHVAAFLLALLLSIGLMAYLAVGRRPYIVPIMMTAVIGTLLLVFASYDFSPDAFSYFFRSGAGRMWFSLQPARHWFLSLPNSAVALAAVTALLLYLPRADPAISAIPSRCFWPCCSLPSSPRAFPASPPSGHSPFCSLLSPGSLPIFSKPDIGESSWSWPAPCWFSRRL
jgi:hypothetical protein